SGHRGESIFAHHNKSPKRFFKKELTNKILHRELGLISMIDMGQDSHGSQFLLTLNKNLSSLNSKCTIFGQITEGLNIIEKFNSIICDSNNRPLKDIRITHTTVIEDPFDDPEWLVSIISNTKSPLPPTRCFNSNFISINESDDEEEFHNSSSIPVEDSLRDKNERDKRHSENIEKQEARSNAKILEMVGDIPHANIRPDENILFVCKLNPITTADDLELIFSRFGPILRYSKFFLMFSVVKL
ncbi:MAG: Peptidyl-prolyl cis-trans isomerase-like 4, partial [Paramarteilia canceri]